ncbi:MAG: hypothetical protein KDE53_11220, partial [Caldilineaceae bacterium]|nr:hypothetical protein [Caldilineaceae bacterium]
EPLCQFLGVPVPDTPFPHVNDSQAMKKRLNTLRLTFRLAPALLVGFVVAIGAVVAGLL